MNTTAGKILISTPSLEDTNFDKVIIFLAECNEKGALGFVINKPFHRRFNELTEFMHSLPFPLYEGGPVIRESLFFLHRRPDLVTGGTQVMDSIYLGGNFKKAVQYINDETIAETEIKLFIGYCGWDNGELQAEIEEGSWSVSDISVEAVFSSDLSLLWESFYPEIK